VESALTVSPYLSVCRRAPFVHAWHVDGRIRIVLLFIGSLVLFLAIGSLYRVASRPRIEALEAARHRLARVFPEEETEDHCLAVVDFSRPAWHRRLALYERNGDLKGTFLVAHARNSGDYTRATSFSNDPDSNRSSLGLYRILNLYRGDHGLALRLEGLDPGLNDRARERDIVIHGADYVSLGSIVENAISGRGFGVGRSLGCPAVSMEAMPVLVETLQAGDFLFIHR